MDAYGPPPFPNVFSGAVTIDDEVAADGIEIYAKVAEGSAVYETIQSAAVAGGKYSSLKVAPPTIQFGGDDILFFAWVDGAEIQATETIPFDAAIGLAESFLTLDLTFTTSGS